MFEFAMLEVVMVRDRLRIYLKGSKTTYIGNTQYDGSNE